MNKKSKFIGLFLFCFLSIFLISCVNATKQEVLNQVESGNYQQALNDINGLNTAERGEVQKVALSKVDTIVEMVEAKQMTFSQGVDDLNFIKRIVPKVNEAKVNEAIEYLKSIEPTSKVEN